MAVPIGAIFFDAVGTLLHPEPAAAVVYAAVGRRFGSNYTVPEIQTRFAAAFECEEAADRIAGWQTSEEREYRRWRAIVGAVLDDVNDPEACFRELYAHFARPEAWRFHAEAGPVIEQFAASGLRLGLASNYDRRLYTVAAGFAPLRVLKHVVISSEAGWRKPARGFFEAICRRVQAPAEQILHVGDDPANDYEGAIVAGLRAALFDGKRRYTTFAGPRLEQFLQLPACIHSLDRIIKLTVHAEKRHADSRLDES